MTKIISIANQKGGVAKTSTAINLAYSLTQEKLGSNRILLIDFDPQGNATTGLNFSQEIQRDLDKTQTGLYRILTEQEPIVKGIYETEFENLDIIPAFPSLKKLEGSIKDEFQRESFLKNSIETSWDVIKKEYDYIIIDNNPSLGLLVHNSLMASDYVIVPVKAGKFSFDGLSQMSQEISRLQSANKKLEILGVLITIVDQRTKSEEFYRSALKGLPFNIFETSISQNVDMERSQLQGLPVLDYNPQAKSGQQYMELAKEILNKINND
jgi:chromosome partitioning protein